MCCPRACTQNKCSNNDIDHQDVSPLSRLCKKKVSHVVSLCSVLAGNQNRKRHDKLGEKVHWLLCKKFQTECEDKWFSHQSEPVLENEKCKILWDFPIERDREIPDIIVKEKSECKIINIAVPGDQKIKAK